MYNRYVPRGNGYTRVRVEEEPEHPGTGPPASDEKKYTPAQAGTQAHGEVGQKKIAGPDPPQHKGDAAGFAGDKSGGLKRLLKGLNLEGIDSGDLLLFLIILLLLTDGDELDMVITLGLMLLLGLGDKKSPDSGLSGLLKSFSG